MRLAKAFLSSTAADRRMSLDCPKCGAAPRERCRKRTPERYTSSSEGLVQGEGRWTYLSKLHPERRDPAPQGSWARRGPPP